MIDNDPHKGKISRAYVFRCLDCDYVASYEWTHTERFMLLSYAAHWARRDGWSKTKDGWKCSTCKARANYIHRAWVVDKAVRGLCEAIRDPLSDKNSYDPNEKTEERKDEDEETF